MQNIYYNLLLVIASLIVFFLQSFMCFCELSQLGMCALGQVVEIISASIGDMMRAEFTALQDCHGNAVLPVDGVTMSDWEHQTFLATGSLISSSCKAALMLAHHPVTLQQQAYVFGRQIALAYQVCVEYNITA